MLRGVLLLSALTCTLAVSGCGSGLEEPHTDQEGVRHATDTLPSSYDPGDLLQLYSTFGNGCVETTSWGAASGTQLTLGRCDKRINQQFWAQQQGDGNYVLSNAWSGQCAWVAGDSKDNGAGVILWPCVYPAAPNEAWQLIELSPGVYQLRGASSGKCLDLPTTGKGPLQQWDCHSGTNQRWQLRGAPRTEIRIDTGSGGPAKCATAMGTANGTRIEQWDCAGTRNQQFGLGQQPDGSYELIARNSNLCVDIAGRSADNGTPAQQWTCSGAFNQRFWVSAWSGSGTSTRYRLGAGHVSKCLDRNGHPNSSNGAPLQLWACTGNNNQAFWLPGF